MLDSHTVAKMLLAAPPFPMSRVPVPSKKLVAGDSEPKKAKYKGKPDSEFALRLHALYGRRAETRWTVEEVELFLQLKPSYDPEEMTMLETYYRAEMKKGRDGGGMWRGSLDTLLRNWNTEIDRARQFCASRQKRLTRFDPPAAPANVVPMQPENEAELRAKAAVEFQKARAAL